MQYAVSSRQKIENRKKTRNRNQGTKIIKQLTMKATLLMSTDRPSTSNKQLKNHVKKLYKNRLVNLYKNKKYTLDL